jgi:hypothetical protein
VKPALLVAVVALSACILPDLEIDVVNEDIQNKQAVRIVEPIELTDDATAACELAANEADKSVEICPQPGLGALPHFLDPSVSLYNFCACDKGERHKKLRESTLYVEDRDDRRKEGKDPLYAALQLDLDPTTSTPHLYVRYTDFVDPQVELPEDDQISYKPVKRPDPKVRVLKLGAGDERIDLCNDVDDLDRPLAAGYHTVRLIVTDRAWYTNDDGELQRGVPDLASGATYDTITYVFHCDDKTAEHCQTECVPEDDV